MSEPGAPESATPLAVERLEGRVALAAAALEVVKQAHLEICLFSDELDPDLYGEAGFVSALRQFVLRHQRTRVRVLLAHSLRAARGPHALVDLARALPSYIELRELPSEQRAAVDEQLIADGRVLLERASAHSLDARLYRADPMRAREYQRRFDRLWDVSSPAQDLRRLRL